MGQGILIHTSTTTIISGLPGGVDGLDLLDSGERPNHIARASRLYIDEP